MMTNDRHADPFLADDEILFRRFRPEDFENGEVPPEAFELPDMSVARKKYGPAEWLLLDEACQTWGVAGFRVRDIPREEALLHLGVIAYVLRPEHVPLKYNYPHSEIRIYRDGSRICKDHQNLALLEPVFHIRWRERLSQASWAVIHPKNFEMPSAR
jgi:hypothetical protein